MAGPLELAALPSARTPLNPSMRDTSIIAKMTVHENQSTWAAAYGSLNGPQ